MSRVSFYTRPYDRLEPYDGKLSRTVLRGGAGSNAILLPDKTGRNLALRCKTRRRFFLPLEELPFELPDEALAETGLFQNEQHQQLYAALGKLKKEYRETLFLVYFEELSYRQAAQVLGRTEQQVTNLVYRGKQQLKQLLEQEGYQYEN